jgi:hypothetical protein
MRRLVVSLAVFALGAGIVFGCGGGGHGYGGGGNNYIPPSPSPGGSPSPSPTPSPGSSPTPTPSPGATPALPDQPGAIAVPSQIFPANDDWNTDVSGLPVLAMSNTYINSIGANTTLHPDFGTTYNNAPIGIPFIVVTGSQMLVPIDFMFYASESDPGPYPIPANAPIEGVNPGQLPPFNGAGDQHSLILDKDHMKLYEFGLANPPGNPTSSWSTDSNWSAAGGAVWDLTKVASGQRPVHWTSADAAGLPIFPGLARYDEIVTKGVLTHALRLTVNSSQNAFYPPASHQAGSANTALPPMGLRIRLKASFTISNTLPLEVQALLTGFKKYGLIVADNGSSWYISGAPDSRWNDGNLHSLNVAKGSDFECVDTGASLMH